VTDKFSLGAAVPIMYSELDMDVAVPNPENPVIGPEGKVNLDGDDLKAAGTLSFLYEFSERTRLGGRATSKFDFDYDGNISAELLGEVGVETNLTMASVARVGLTHDINKKWSVHTTWGWDNWSELKDVFISNNTRGATLPRNWDDTYHYAVGADYRLDDSWTLRAGIGYDTDPVDPKDRTADMPLDEQYRYAAGFDYVRKSGMRISGSLVYADYGDAEIDSNKGVPGFGLNGDYKTNEIWFASISFNWQLGD
jgi:long-chain fatty acid transport protein